MIKNIFYFFVIFQITFQLIFGLQPQSWLYSPQYSYIVKASNQQSLFSKILVSSVTGLVFISAGNEGLKVLDPKQQYQIIAQLKSKDYVEGFAITQDGRYIFIQNESRLTIYNFDQVQKTFSQVGQDDQQVYLIDVLINKVEDTIYVLQVDGLVRILDISKKDHPTFMGQILWYSQQIYGAYLSDNEKFLLLCQDYQGLGIFTLNKQDKQIKGTFLGSFSGETQGGSHKVIITSDQKYIINLDQRNGISFAYFSQVQNAAIDSKPYSFSYFLNQWWPSQVVVPSPYSLCLSQDNNFLFVGVRSIGIYTIDITDKYSPQTYIWSYFSHHGNSIVLSPNQKYLYFSNSVSFMAFRKTKPSLGNKYVSLYNGNHSISFDQSTTKYYWRCDYDPYRQVFIGAFNTDGLWFVDTRDPVDLKVIQSQYKPPGQNASIDVFYALNKYSVLLTSMNDGVNFMAVLDISNYQDIKVIQKVPLGIPVTSYIKDIDYNMDNTFVSVSMNRIIVFVDIQEIKNFFILAIWEFLPYMKGFTTGVMISSDSKYFVGACRSYGYFVLDIQDFKNIHMVNYINSTGAEQVYKSLVFSYQYYLVDGLGGLYIMDQTKLPQLVQFSQLNIEGWTNDITFLQNEQTVIVATLQQGMIHLIDISDNKNPFIVSSYQYGEQNGFFSCSTQDFGKLFINNNIEMTQLPLAIPAQLHTDYLEVLGYSETGEMLFNIIDDPDNFKFLVGQTVKFNLCFLYQPLDLVVNELKFIQYQHEIPLPSWVVYDPVELSATIQLTNAAVDPTNIKKPLLNTLILNTIRPLTKFDFLYNIEGFKTTIEQAESIYQQFQQDGVIDENRLVPADLSFNSLQFIELRNDTLFPSETQEQQDFNKKLSEQLKYTLLNSISNTPVYFLVYPSLNLVVDGSTKSFIQTTAPVVSIQIEIPKFSGKFIYSNKDSLNIQVNPDLNLIIVSGRQGNVNSFLENKVIIFPLSPTNYRDITVAITVTDSMNYPIVKNDYAFSIPFLIEKQSIYQNPDKQLQNQFSDYIEIDTEFSFGIDPLTFIIPDIKSKVQYNVFKSKGGDFVELDSSDWLQFDSQLNKFYGIPPKSSFQTSLEIQVEGSDGYTTSSQTFVIHVTKLPLTLLMQLIVTIVGPITGVIGLYKFRGDLYNIFYRKRNMYSRVSCKPNQNFILKIPLILNEVAASIEIMDRMKKKLQKIKAQEQKQLKSLNSQPSRRQSVVQKKSERTQKKKITKLMKINTTINKGINYFQELVSINLNSIASNYKKRLQIFSKSDRQSQFEKLYLKPNGSLNYNLFLDHLIEHDFKFKFNNQPTSTRTYRDELTKYNSVLEQCLKYQLAIKLIKFDKKSQIVFDFLKYYSLATNPHLTKNDWYKHLVNIKSTEELDQFGNAIIFPDFSFYYLRLSKALKLLDIQIDKELQQLENTDINLINSKKEKIYDEIYESKDINLHLIEQFMFSQAAGVFNKLPNSFFPSTGESICIEYHEINSLVALRYNPGTFQCLEKIFGVDYKPYGPKGNIQLPNWLQLETMPGLIILKGTPEFANAEDLLIKITTVQNYDIRSFMLNVEKDIIQFTHYRQSISLKKSNVKSKVQKKKGQKIDSLIKIKGTHKIQSIFTTVSQDMVKQNLEKDDQVIIFSDEEDKYSQEDISSRKQRKSQINMKGTHKMQTIFTTAGQEMVKQNYEKDDQLIKFSDEEDKHSQAQSSRRQQSKSEININQY